MNPTNALLIANIILVAIDLYLQIRESWRRYKKRKEDEWFNSL